jgi:hypothetical protein
MPKIAGGMRTMTRQDIETIAIPHLGTQFELAVPIMFTGAGFSQSARSRNNDNLPSSADLKRTLWSLCFQGVPFESESSLQDLYETAVRQHRKGLTELINRLFTVDAESLPGWYELVFSMPWARCYTLNVDDLGQAANRKFKLPRPIAVESATSGVIGQSTSSEALAIVHLNGTLQDVPDGITFSITQYAARLARPDPWYIQLAANLVSHPVVFIGTRLDEPRLWQYLELRKWRAFEGREKCGLDRILLRRTSTELAILF